MTRKKLLEFFKRIKCTYPYGFKDFSETDIEIWLDTWDKTLTGYDDNLIEKAFFQVICESKVPPVPADIIEAMGKLETINEPSDAALWGECASLIYELQDKFYCAFHFGHNPVEEKKYKAAWDNANEIVKEFLGTASNAVSINTETLDFEKSRFYKALPTIRKRVRDKRKLENLSISASDLKLIGRNGETEI